MASKTAARTSARPSRSKASSRGGSRPVTPAILEEPEDGDEGGDEGRGGARGGLLAHTMRIGQPRNMVHTLETLCVMPVALGMPDEFRLVGTIEVAMEHTLTNARWTIAKRKDVIEQLPGVYIFVSPRGETYDPDDNEKSTLAISMMPVLLCATPEAFRSQGQPQRKELGRVKREKFNFVREEEEK